MVKIEKIFDIFAKNYDKTEEVRFKQYTILTLKNTLKYLNADDIILDYGCATGTKALELAGNVKKIYALDISSKMIELAQRKAFQHKISNVDFAQTTIFDKKYKKETFDVILAFNILHLLDDIQHVIHRINELLKHGGLFITTTPCLSEKMTFLTKLQFSFFLLLIKFKLFPHIKKFKFDEIKDLISIKNLKIIENKKYFQELSSYFIVAKKIK